MLRKKLLTSVVSGALSLTAALTSVLAVNGTPFTDISKDRVWYTDGVAYCYAHNILTGTSPTTFSPDKNMDRAMLVTALYRMDGQPPVNGSSSFTDVPTDSYYAKAVAWAAANNIVTGFSSTTFKPGDPVTREQFATILARYHVYKGYQLQDLANLSSYPDVDAVAPYALEGMKWAVGNRIITGNQVNGVYYLNPRGESTRAQIATIIFRYRMYNNWDNPSNPDDSQKPEEKPDENPGTPSTPQEPDGGITTTVQNWLNKGQEFFWNGAVSTDAPNIETMVFSMDFSNTQASWKSKSSQGSSKYSVSGFSIVENPASGFTDSAFEGKIVFDDFKIGNHSFKNATGTICLYLTTSQVDMDVWTGLQIIFDNREINELVAHNGATDNGITLNAMNNELFIDDNVDYSNASAATQEVFSILTRTDGGQMLPFHAYSINWDDNGNKYVVSSLTFSKAAMRLLGSTPSADSFRAGGFYRLGEFTKNGDTYAGMMTIDDLYLDGKLYDLGVCSVTLKEETVEDYGTPFKQATLTIIPSNPEMSELVVMKDLVAHYGYLSA